MDKCQERHKPSKLTEKKQKTQTVTSKNTKLVLKRKKKKSCKEKPKSAGLHWRIPQTIKKELM